MPTTLKLTKISSICFALILSILAAIANAQTWQSVDATSVGWSDEGLKAARDNAMAGNKPTAIMVVQAGKVIASWGDTNRKVDVASVRKSLLSALYGIAVSKGRVRLESTLSELGIDDAPPSLTATEKQATVRDLLMSRSGIYHAAAHETGEMRRNRPERGSHAPGTFWWYNNWDFNALGTIYRQQTGEDIFQSFYQRIAVPIAYRVVLQKETPLELLGRVAAVGEGLSAAAMMTAPPLGAALAEFAGISAPYLISGYATAFLACSLLIVRRRMDARGKDFDARQQD